MPDMTEGVICYEAVNMYWFKKSQNLGARRRNMNELGVLTSEA